MGNIQTHNSDIFAKFAPQNIVMTTFSRHIRLIVVVLVVCATMALRPTPTHAADSRPFVVVIDPGHGGKDYGAIGERTNEKAIVLDVGLLLGKMISKAYKATEVKVVYTRNRDYFVELQERANIANRAKGDLFISIHANSVDKRNRNRKHVNGTSVYTLGVDRAEKNLAVAQRENSVIVLENDYSERYEGFDPSSAESYIIFELEQNRHMVQSLDFASKAQHQLVYTAGRADKKVRQAGFWVLHATSMPAVLVELDFICNPDMESFMASENGRNKLATALFTAFAEYKADYDRKIGLQGSPAPQVPTVVSYDNSDDNSEATTEPAKQESEHNNNELLYSVQFLTSKSALAPGDPKLKGITDAECYEDRGLLKYHCGATTSFDEAKRRLAKVQKSFPDAFIIRIKNGKRVK